ncbi:MAG: hypothetical protein A2Y37_05760 [Spirochaetes bacterium GWB1_60_80]|nr:MAG: hypothetical protein A2Y37_05760 [Spirochaetes bacterium GWB1_60_80]OHD42970.1 MAG: hypothetical protein A2Y35_14180 [Spirochaetes bacterium GWE1_60_18]
MGRGGSPGAGYGRTPFFSSDPAIGQDRAAFANQALLDRRAALQAELARVEAALGAADNANGPDEAGPAAP